MSTRSESDTFISQTSGERDESLFTMNEWQEGRADPNIDTNAAKARIDRYQPDETAAFLGEDFGGKKPNI